MNVLEISNLNKKYNKADEFSIKDVNFSLEKGFIMGLIGENGAGKTSIINMIMNVVKKDSGQIKIFDMDNVDYDRDIKQRMGFVYDTPLLYPKLTGYEMKSLVAPLYKNWDENQFKQYLEMFEIDGSKKVENLSKGMQMKLSIALAFSHHAEFIVMDEPTSGLDPLARREILEIIQDLVAKENTSFIFSTHITTDLDKVADYITYIDKGSVKLSMTTENLKEKFKIIKGALSDFKETDERFILGIEKTRIGYAGLIKTEELELISSNNYIENIPTIEDIMYYMGRD